jgi:tetratricopeptide (TPR) repeat protein
MKNDEGSRSAQMRRPRPSSPKSAPVQQQSLAKIAVAQKQESRVHAANGLRGYVAISEGDIADCEPLKTSFFNSINNVKAMTVANEKLPAKRSLASARGYDVEDLYAIAEVAYHYLMGGGLKLAFTLFEGLVAVRPEEAYFSLGLGLSHDHLGNKREAFDCYTRAAELDQGDARPDINRAELLLERRDYNSARRLLTSAVNKARRRRDEALERKACALLKNIDRAA